MKRKREDLPAAAAPAIAVTPSNRRNRTKDLISTPSKDKANGTPRKVAFLAPDDDDDNKRTLSPSKGTPRTPRHKTIDFNDPSLGATNSPILRNVNRSARRKSVRNLIQRSIRENLADEDEGFDEEDEFAQRIFDDDDDAGSSESDSDMEEEGGEPSKAATKGRGRKKATTTDGGDAQTPATPSKRKPGRRKKVKSPPPPLTTEGPSAYFDQNRTRSKPSSTTTQLPPLSPSRYFRLLSEHQDPHKKDITHLSTLHAANFPQWLFELSQSFNICLYGYGSKRALLMDFIKLPASLGHHVVVINGYVAGLSLRDIFSTIATTILDLNHAFRLPPSPNEQLDAILTLINEYHADNPSKPITLLLHSIDASAVLRTAQTQSLLAQLASHPSIQLIASADTILHPLLWDSSTLTQFNFLFHDATTFKPYDLEISAADEGEGIVDVISGGTAGRSGRSGARGVKYVLASLTNNAKQLYKILVAAQVQAMEDSSWPKEKTAGEGVGVEWKSLYLMGLKDFVCSSELVFRTLLKEFYDHQMVTSRKDLQGTETLWAPFKREELESILEDLLLG